MIPVMAVMLCLFIVTACIDMARREQDRAGGGTVVSVMAVITLLVAIGGTTWILKASYEAGQELERAQRQLERLQWP